MLSGPASSPIDFVSAQTNLVSVSAALATQTPNGTTTFDGFSTYRLVGTGSSLNVFTLTGPTFSSKTINITAPASSTDHKRDRNSGFFQWGLDQSHRRPDRM
jgi:choice-of-anchor A domain-containing protein